MKDDFKNINKYIETRQPATYQDFIAYVKPLMNSRQKEKLRKLLNFHFKNHSKYRLSKKRLKQLEIVIQQRAASFLD